MRDIIFLRSYTLNNVDSGLVLRNDLYFSGFNIGDKDRWRPYVFFDYANFRSRDRNLIMPDGSVSTRKSENFYIQATIQF